MRHIVTISLVFFSLAHLAKAEQRMDGLRLLTEGYCKRQQLGAENIVLGVQHPDDEKHHFFLSYGELALIGTAAKEQVPTYSVCNHIVAYLSIRQNAKNNSP
ncbi:hypothetical protein [Pedobacter sp. ASV28]|uniref:hypothetical protein n=1 Tax=Pedobacter sp. ASV28 TaxID=2795123 RepID=UPI0018EC7E6C|nr:hypothetical protein [Pedobacter sp. ASV28]